LAPGDVGTTPPDEGHLGTIHGQPRGDVGARTAAMHGDGGGSVAALGEGKRSVGDRVGHQVTNDDNARHVYHLITGTGALTGPRAGAGLAD
jgi:hypothetical protein